MTGIEAVVAILVILFSCAMMVLDMMLTLRAIKAGGKELNPVMNWLATKFGGLMPAMIVTKTFAVIAAFVAANAVAGLGTLWMLAMFAIPGIIHLPVVLWNLKVLRGLKK